MNRVTGVWLVVVGCLAVQQVGFTLPARLTHHLTPHCAVEPQEWLRGPVGRIALAAGLRTPPAALEGFPGSAACERRRGLKSQTPFLKQIRQRWPSEAELTAWEKADDDAIHVH